MWTCPKCAQRVDDQFEVCWKCGTSMAGEEDPTFFADREDSPPQEGQSAPEPRAQVPENLVTITSCSLPAEALAMRLKLENAGIAVFLADEYTVVMDWLLSNAIGGIKVQVADHEVLQARQILGLDLSEAEDEGQEEEDGEDEEDQEEEEKEPDEEETQIKEKPEDY
jgi:hypothetical protein